LYSQHSEAEAGGLKVQGQPSYIVRPYLKNQTNTPCTINVCYFLKSKQTEFWILKKVSQPPMPTAPEVWAIEGLRVYIAHLP
jgi:hypothetical protein